MATTNINIRIDEDLKQRFEAFCDDVGMNVTTAVTMFIKASLRENEIPFKITNRRESRFNPYFAKSPYQTILDGIEDLNNGGGTFHELIETEDDE
ncbi:MAG: type II toxin-antitoxin system RelB/DinJ family antitoxin [Oscillospiraceae bacterium]|nr:type II toxin-antitoxin system RelB/DinJ family antitoxin [Oscillospiraceae bacterium]